MLALRVLSRVLSSQDCRYWPGVVQGDELSIFGKGYGQVQIIVTKIWVRITSGNIEWYPGTRSRFFGSGYHQNRYSSPNRYQISGILNFLYSRSRTQIFGSGCRQVLSLPNFWIIGFRQGRNHQYWYYCRLLDFKGFYWKYRNLNIHIIF